ncbi:MAG: phosphate ABC transporter, permease protein PstA, partial [Lactobacillus sp.]|nr:phosphate ABC transporter, permease protein PstA [Lactobacillus sp.]
MNAKKTNRIAAGVIYFLVGIVILLLIGIIGNILITGVPHLSWHFLSSESSSFKAGGGIRDQL